MPVHPLVAARFPLLDGIPVPLIDGIPDFDESLNNPELTQRFLAFADMASRGAVVASVVSPSAR